MLRIAIHHLAADGIPLGLHLQEELITAHTPISIGDRQYIILRHNRCGLGVQQRGIIQGQGRAPQIAQRRHAASIGVKKVGLADKDAGVHAGIYHRQIQHGIAVHLRGRTSVGAGAGKRDAIAVYRAVGIWTATAPIAPAVSLCAAGI